jgi:hypothetical protein
LFASDEWLIKMIAENLKNNEIDNVKEISMQEKYNEISKLTFNELKLLEALNRVVYKKNKIKKNKFTLMKSHIKEFTKYNEKIFDISKYKSPNKIPNERQFEIGYSHLNEEDYLRVSFLPASHLLNDDNREYFGESELKIAYLSVLLNKNSIELDELTIYGMKSYVPYDTLTNDLSYQFEISVKKEYTKQMNYIDTFKLDGGVGLDFLLLKDINIFAILNLGVGYNYSDEAHVFLNPQIGTMIYEVLNMKSLFYYQPLYINSDKVYDKYVLNHNIFISNKYKFYFNYEQVHAKKNYNNYEFGLSMLF